MKRTLHPLLFFVSTLILTSMACATLTGGLAPTEIVATLAPPTVVIPTSTLPVKEQPTSALPTVGPQKFFTEEFGENLDQSSWYYFVSGPGEDSDLRIEQEGEGLTFDLGALDLYLYYIYEPFEYKDTKLTLVAENQGVNNNNVSLVCRLDYDADEWYEYSFESGGVWYLYAYKDGYNTLDNGGSNDLNQGKAVNEYSMTCEGNVITMYINGKKLKSYTDKTYGFSDGQVGFNVSSLNVLPVIVNVQSFDIAEP